VKWEPDCVAGCKEVWETVDVSGDVVWLLGLEEREESLERFREDEWFFVWRDSRWRSSSLCWIRRPKPRSWSTERETIV
jgi:hypothetical protein